MLEDTHVGFIGGGNMGEALIKGLLSASLLSADRLHVFDVISSRMEYLAGKYHVQPAVSVGGLAGNCHIIVLAVKPQNMASVLGEMNSHLSHKPLVISIAAGVPLSTLTSGLSDNIPVIRVMPNTPAIVLEAASALARGPHVTDSQMLDALALFRAVGKAVEVEEKWMDAVTGLSGSGPAYILLVIESLIDGGVLMGLPRQVARELVVQTVLGTAKMVQETGNHPAELKDLITSPGGTTIRGLKIMEEQGVRGSLIEAVEAATLRSRELVKD
ncbi:MAG: pyrroline-5-carboxylate reductase [Deltaproteobacteria bacterium]|nr:pyrroline-5-carboxylate reductase [Deltaproteobacteria bacterium]